MTCMGGSGMKIYLDSIFLLNGVINYLLLLVSGKVAGEPFRRRWLAVGGAMGAGITGLRKHHK